MFLVLYEAGTWHISLECVERHVHATSNREEVERGLTLMGVCERTISRDKKQVCFTTTDWDAARELGGVHSGSVVDNGCIWCSSAEVGVLERNTQRRLCLQCPLKAPCFSVQENLDRFLGSEEKSVLMMFTDACSGSEPPSVMTQRTVTLTHCRCRCSPRAWLHLSSGFWFAVRLLPPSDMKMKVCMYWKRKLCTGTRHRWIWHLMKPESLDGFLLYQWPRILSGCASLKKKNNKAKAFVLNEKKKR